MGSGGVMAGMNRVNLPLLRLQTKQNGVIAWPENGQLAPTAAWWSNEGKSPVDEDAAEWKPWW
jgi:hypothetical protein